MGARSKRKTLLQIQRRAVGPAMRKSLFEEAEFRLVDEGDRHQLKDDITSRLRITPAPARRRAITFAMRSFAYADLKKADGRQLNEDYSRRYYTAERLIPRCVTLYELEADGWPDSKKGMLWEIFRERFAPRWRVSNSKRWILSELIYNQRG